MISDDPKKGAKEEPVEEGVKEEIGEYEVYSRAEEVTPIKIAEMRERAAKTIAECLVVGFLILLGLPMVYLFYKGGPVSEVTDMIKTISAVLSGTIGAILGYYFKGARD